MMTIEMRFSMSAGVLGVALFSEPAWADRDRRADVPPIPTGSPAVMHGGQPQGAEPTPESMSMTRDGVSVDSDENGNRHSGGVYTGADRSPVAGAYPSTNVTRPSEISKPESGAAGIPLWRW
jgi:hypothetical protein